jgi:sulfur carrier protein
MRRRDSAIADTQVFSVYLNNKGGNIMKITINGVASEVGDNSTIITVITQKGLQAQAVVIEHNYEIIQQQKWDSVKLQQDDKLEIVTFVGGG